MTGGAGMLRRILIVSVSAASLVAGCGGDDDAAGASSADDQQTAEQAVAVAEESLRDAGFSAMADEDEDDDDLKFKSDECRKFESMFTGAKTDIPGQTATAESQGFERAASDANPVYELVGAETWLVEDPSDLDPVLEQITDERLGDCVQEALRGDIETSGEDVQINDTRSERLGSDGLGDAGGGVELSGNVTNSGDTVPYSIAMQFVNVDRALVGVAALALGPGEATVDRTALLQAMVDAVSDTST